MAGPIIRADTAAAEQFLDGLYKDQIPFAASLALNQTAKDVQRAEQVQIASNFVLRQAAFNLRHVRIPKFSNKADRPMTVTVEIGERGAYLKKFQAPGTKTALDPSNPIAIPSTNIRPSFGDSPARALYPKNLRLVPRKAVTGMLPAQRHVTRHGVVQLKGKRRTFVLDPTEHRGVKTWGVYQRTGPGRGDVRLIWTYKSRIPIPRLLDFMGVGERVVAERWTENFAQAFARAIRSAK